MSPNFSISSNMRSYAMEDNLSIQSLPNINAVWAWLIVEECTRLGLTYFCIAPGSRSSPLAVAASTHPLASCVACYDERSLAFHAVGYARGSHKPAVVITTSGTAVSNLLPAVVEAAQDFVPLMLLTADRPPELQDAGANQSINQVNHFGSFSRSFFSLPTPTDEIQAKMVLTTIDSAVNLATTSPSGPVHINCPFREPLDNSPSVWNYSSLEGLDFWISTAEPFTKYIKVHYPRVSSDAHDQLSEVIKVLQGAKQGLILIGALHSEDEMWAALLLAKHLEWPVVADVLSGLRLRKRLSPLPETESKVFFLDYLDHILLSDLVRCWAQADVILQIGSRMTSKRISQLLEGCYPMSYIMVDSHPFRHDPSHIVTHRVQSTITEFAGCMLKAHFPSLNSKWIGTLHLLNTMVEREISFQICADSSLREPYIAYAVSKAISRENALFIGNSMAIRDADMYGRSGVESGCCINTMLGLGLPCQGIMIAGNRGASGIDGLLSTAIGFAAGCQKRVICLLGDVSFLHDTNGLAILNERIHRKPLTIVVINNHGGAIFRLLPISNTVERQIVDQFFYTSHNVSVSNLCLAHGVKYLKVTTKPEFQGAISTSKAENSDIVIEVESWIEDNAIFHSGIRNSANETADNVLTALSKACPPDSVHHALSSFKIHKMEFFHFRVSLNEPPTSDTMITDLTTYYREGFIATIYLDDGSVGHGEIAPLDVHKENLVDVDGQLCFLMHALKGVEISYVLALMKGSFSTWIWNNLGLPPHSIFPSVRCGLEMAILNALAARRGSSLFKLLYPHSETSEGPSEASPSIRVCGLIDSNGTPAQMAHVAGLLVEDGFSAIKLKVARRSDPLEDAEVIKEVRKKVGRKIAIRADANRKWSYEEAVQFAHSVKNYNIQYLEEPVQHDADILRFCEETGIAVALDETLSSIQGNPIDYLSKFNHPGIAAVVIKPSVVGGFENASLIAQWAQWQGKIAVISSAFESSVGLAAFVQFSSYINSQDVDILRVKNKETNSSVAHGLGTYKWLKEDITSQTLNINRKPDTGIVEAYVADADELLKTLQINKSVILRSFNEMPVHTYQLNLDSAYLSCSVKVQEIGPAASNNVLIFLHGFLGTSDDWIDIMKVISGSARCISLDIPGHGRTKIRNHGTEEWQECSLSMEVITDFLHKLICHVTPHKVTLVGYSMGARIGLYMAVKFASKVEGAIVISGSPGLKDEASKKIRRKIDDSRTRSLIGNGLQLFLDNWYAGELWDSLRDHPRFKSIVTSRSQHDDISSLAKSLSGLSIGRQQSLWGDLMSCTIPILIIVGEKDTKFRRIAREMLLELGSSTKSEDNEMNDIHQMVEVPGSGHAVHLENPLAVIKEIRQFLAKIKL
uniref:Mandelate racemase/muconate lactonizing enzyme C-terminal domain-containing protein n=2 Tax=Kalanchoe fedtschenkoi TaxID=63787 RepID=A0A7N0VBE5_KALFE